MRKNRFLKIRISEKEDALIDACAKAEGLTVTKYIRSLLPRKTPTKNVGTKSAENSGNTIGAAQIIEKKSVPTKPKQITKLEKAQNSYRRFAEPGALLKK